MRKTDVYGVCGPCREKDNKNKKKKQAPPHVCNKYVCRLCVCEKCGMPYDRHSDD